MTMYKYTVDNLPIITTKNIKSFFVADHCMFAASVNILTDYHVQYGS